MFGLEKSTTDEKRGNGRIDDRMREVEVQLEMMKREREALLAELELSEEEIREYLEKRENFTEDAWEFMREANASYWDKVESDLQTIKNVRQTKAHYKELREFEATCLDAG